MAKKPQPEEFNVPPETITKGGSYIVDPVAKTVTRNEWTKQKDEIAQEQAAEQPAQPEAPKE